MLLSAFIIKQKMVFSPTIFLSIYIDKQNFNKLNPDDGFYINLNDRWQF